MAEQFAGDGISMMPLQFPQIDLSPFLGSFTKIPLVQSSGTCSSSHIISKRLWKLLIEILSNVFIASGGMLSIPPALPFFRCFIAVVTSVLVMGQVLILRTCPLSIDGGFVGGGLFRTSWKCSCQRVSCSSGFVSAFPFLSFTNVLALDVLPLSCLVML